MTIRSLRQRLASWLLVGGACLLMATGCGGPKGPQRIEVKGKVTVDGAPLAIGSITWTPVPETKGPAANTSIKEGEFRFTKEDGPIAGPHQVVITIPPSKATAPPAAGAKATPSKTNWTDLEQVTVPEKGPFEKNFDLK